VARIKEVKMRALDSNGNPLVLTTEEALKICDQFPALIVQEVNFTGGEPTLREDL